jgi:hypothetical protein
VYGQTYNACVKAVYGSGYSPQICVTFQSKFLYPARDLTATAVECNAYLTWKKPQTLADGPDILSMEPRTEFPNPTVDYSPNVYTTSPAGDASDAIWDILFSWNASAASETGCDKAGDFIYTSLWNGTSIKKYQATTGTLLETFDIPGTNGIRDLAYDGTQYWYGGANAGSSIYKMDFVTKTLVSTISTSVASVRHCAYDPTNGGRLWVGGWNDMFLVSMTGTTLATGPAMTSAYGSAYDPDAAGPYLWVHAQNGSPQDEIQQFKIAGTTLTSTGLTHNLGTIPGFNAGIAGGLGAGNVGTKFALIASIQQSPNLIVALELHAATSGGGGGTPPGLIGYNIYRGGNFIHYNPHPDSITYYDYGLNPGTYKYEVKAKYDLTPYGFAGQFGESLGNTAGEKTITTVCGAPLPFYEPWDNGNFVFNQWQPNGHWMVNTGIGNPAPSADFHWDPAITNYSQALTSEVIDASAWTCAKIWLDFDVKLLDRNNTGKEKLTIDLYYNGSWHQKLELTNNGSTAWVPKHLDITSVKGKAFRVRFVANGENSADMLHWYVDNIHAYGICTPPTNLQKSQSQFTTNLTWTAPNCGSGSSGVIMNFIFDDGTAESGVTDNGEVAWLGTEFPISNAYDGVLKEFKIYWMANASGAPFTMQVDVYDMAHTLLGTSATFQPSSDDWITVTAPDIPFAGPFYAMVKWNNNPSQTNYLGWDNNGPYASQDLGWYRDATGAWAKLSTLGLGTGNGCFMIQAKAFVNSDDKMVTLVPGAPATTLAAPVKNLASVNRVMDTHYYGIMGVEMTDESDSSVLTGYNVYRTSNNGALPYAKLNANPLTATTYSDVHPSTTPMGTFWKYYVTSVYKNSADNTILCESSTDTVTVTFPAVGVNELNNGQVMIYPNPASDNVNVKSDFTITRLDVMNFAGQTVLIINDVNSKVTRINVASLSSGVYFVKVTTAEGVRMVKITVTH